MQAVAAALALAMVVIGAQSGRAQQISPALASKAPEAGTLATTAQTNGHVRVIVILDIPAAPTQAKPDAAAIASIKAQVAATQNNVLARHFGDALNLRPGLGFERHLSRFQITPGFAISVDAAELDALANDSQVKSINIDRAMPPTLLQSLPLIGQPTAYTNGATGAGWAVAVLDTGVQSNHEFLNGKVVAEACFSNANGFGGETSLCPNGLNSQTGAGAADSTTANCISGGTNLCQHGTHVAGIAAGLNTSQSTGEPTNGVARDGKVFAVQIFTRFNDSASCNGSPPCVLSYTSDQVLALDYVYQHLTPVPGVNVASVNMSLGGGPDTSSACDGDSQKTAIDNLRAAGVLTAIAAGNDGSTTQISHPACISSAVAVGSTTKGDVVSSFSNMANIVALLAPGGSGGGSCAFGANNLDILSSFPGLTSGTTNMYACEAGTSMATPHVAGAIAAIRTACPNETAANILSAFQSSGLAITDTRAGAPGNITKSRIRLDAALAALNCNATGTLVVSPTTDINAAGPQGGPFSPASFNYTLTATAGTRGYSISGVPSWLTASSTSGSATTSGTTVSFTVNASANSLAVGTYTASITFTDTTSNTTALTISGVLVVDDAGVLQVSPTTNMASVGNPGGPFSPSPFQYQLSTNNGSVSYSISGLPSWLDVSASSGTATTSPTTITFTVNSNANSLPVGGYSATIVFTNLTNDRGSQTRNAALTVNSNGAAPPAMRTWVSGTGNDGNDCTLVAPCSTFAGALAKTAGGGEINCLDAGDFGAVTITKSISILCVNGTGSIVATGGGGDAVTVQAASTDKVLLAGIDMEGSGSGLNGVRILSAGTVTIRNCSIRNFTQRGVELAASNNARLYLQDSQIINNMQGGFRLMGAGSTNNAVIERSVFDLNKGPALEAIGPGQLILSRNTVGFSNPSVSSSNGAVVISYQNNVFRNSSTGVTSTLPLK